MKEGALRMELRFADGAKVLALSSLLLPFWFAAAKRVVEEYETGLRRIEENGMRRRIFEYYGIPYEPVEAVGKK